MGQSDPLVTEAERRVGQVLKDKWRLTRLIGVGGMAAVYEATHRNGKRVAVKMLHSSLSRDEAQRRRFLREGYAANAIDNPGVVTIDDDDITDDGSAFLVMEFLIGKPLDVVLESAGDRLPADEVVRLMDQLLGVLVAAHAKGVVHRDLKPENLFLTSDGSLKVLDFGIARLREQTNDDRLSQTTAGTLMGTPAYMAPEQARGLWDLVDGRTDLWSVGATMFTLLTGSHVHEGSTSNEQLGLAMTVPARSVKTVLPELPETLAAAVDRALSYNPSARWQSAEEMREALRDVMRELSIELPLSAALQGRVSDPRTSDPRISNPRISNPRISDPLIPDMHRPLAATALAAEPRPSGDPIVPTPSQAPTVQPARAPIVGDGRVLRWVIGAVVLVGAGALFLINGSRAPRSSELAGPEPSPSPQMRMPASAAFASDVPRVEVVPSTAAGSVATGSDSRVEPSRPASDGSTRRGRTPGRAAAAMPQSSSTSIAGRAPPPPSASAAARAPNPLDRRR